jgi:plastocyanin
MLRKLALVLAPAAVALVVAATGAAASTSSIVIQHVVAGCHSWAVDGGTLAPAQTVVVARGTAVTITNNDVMPHTLVQLSGPKAHILRVSTPVTTGLEGTFPAATLAHMGAKLRVVFAKPGTYVFKTKAGEDYASMAGMKTIGEDHVLRLTVTVH